MWGVLASSLRSKEVPQDAWRWLQEGPPLPQRRLVLLRSLPREGESLGSTEDSRAWGPGRGDPGSPGQVPLEERPHWGADMLRPLEPGSSGKSCRHPVGVQWRLSPREGLGPPDPACEAAVPGGGRGVSRCTRAGSCEERRGAVRSGEELPGAGMAAAESLAVQQ